MNGTIDTGRPMRAIRVFHPCLPRFDNLGDIATNAAIRPMLGSG